MHFASWRRVVAGGMLTLGTLALHVAGCGLTGWPASPADADDPNVIKVDAKGHIRLPSNISFKFGMKFSDDSMPALESLRDFLAANADVTKIRVEGHTDNSGNPVARKRLSESRAKAIADWLKAHGVDKDRLQVVGRGDEDPIAENVTAAGRELNNRVEFYVAEVGGAAYAGQTLVTKPAALAEASAAASAAPSASASASADARPAQKGRGTRTAIGVKAGKPDREASAGGGDKGSGKSASKGEAAAPAECPAGCVRDVHGHCGRDLGCDACPSDYPTNCDNIQCGMLKNACPRFIKYATPAIADEVTDILRDPKRAMPDPEEDCRNRATLAISYVGSGPCPGDASLQAWCDATDKGKCKTTGMGCGKTLAGLKPEAQAMYKKCVVATCVHDASMASSIENKCLDEIFFGKGAFKR